ncbi:MAG TPA: flagellar filament capping protein FliD [Bacillota bacterium]|nr:flagellar filament capping protein FliD [Bacillota bacterium]
MTSVSSSTTSNTLSSLSAKTGIGGLVSGMDIDSLVESMTAASRTRILKQQQSLQTLQWKQTAYRSVTTALKEFQSKYLDVLSATNFRSAALFNTIKASSSSDAVTVKATGSSTAGSVVISSAKLATNANITSAGSVSKPLTGSDPLSVSGITEGASFSLNLNGTVRTITFDAAFMANHTGDTASFTAGLQELVDKAFGENMVDVSESGGKLNFTANNSRLTVSTVGGNTAVLDAMGFFAGQSNRINTSATSGTTSFSGTAALSDIVKGIWDGSGLKAGDSFSIELDGATKSITVDADFISAIEGAKDPEKPDNTDAASKLLQEKLQGLVDDSFGKGKITVSPLGGNLSFTAEGSRLILHDNAGTLAKLGFTEGQTNQPSNHTALDDPDLPLSTKLVPNGDGEYKFTINNVEFTAKATDTIGSIISRINSSSAGVTLAYSSITDKFTITAGQSGTGDTLTLSDTDKDGNAGGNFLAALGLVGGVKTEGKNAEIVVDGNTIVRNSNTFDLDGVTVTLNRAFEASAPVTVTTAKDSGDLVDTIKQFVQDYNAMVDLINGLTKEKTYRDYAPLSDDQKAEMSETQIKEYEAKAKSGTLRNDSILNGISSKLNSLVTGFSLNGVSLYTMGITSAGYTENGKLQIDETKLKTALDTKGSEIKALFTSENGISAQLNNIINGAAKTSGVKGSRGSLVEAAGYPSTMSDSENYLTEAMKRTSTYISTLQTKLTDEETRLWSKFTAMETALERLNAQSAMLSQFSSSGN